MHMAHRVERPTAPLLGRKPDATTLTTMPDHVRFGGCSNAMLNDRGGREADGSLAVNGLAPLGDQIVEADIRSRMVMAASTLAPRGL